MFIILPDVVILKSCDRDVANSHDLHYTYISPTRYYITQCPTGNGGGMMLLFRPVANAASNYLTPLGLTLILTTHNIHHPPSNVSTELAKLKSTFEK